MIEIEEEFYPIHVFIQGYGFRWLNNQPYTYQNWLKNWSATSVKVGKQYIGESQKAFSNPLFKWQHELEKFVPLHDNEVLNDIINGVNPGQRHWKTTELCTVVLPQAMYTWAVVDCNRPLEKINVICQSNLVNVGETKVKKNEQIVLHSQHVCARNMAMVDGECYSLLLYNEKRTTKEKSLQLYPGNTIFQTYLGCNRRFLSV